MTERRPYRILAGLLSYAFVPSHALAQNLATGSGFTIPYVRIILALIVCILIAIAAGALLKAANGRGSVTGDTSNQGSSFKLSNMLRLGKRLGHSQSSLKVLEARKITMSADLCKVEVDGETIVLVISQASILVLSRQKTNVVDIAGPPLQDGGFL